MLSTYRRILAKPGTALFSATGLVARLPIAMVGLGIVLLVEDASGSYGVAGAVSAAHLLANAFFAILQGKLLDRLGQSRVLPVVISAWGVALALLMWSVESGWPIGLTYVFAVLAGASLPSVGSCVRARWSLATRDPDELQTAFALEAVADEAVFITGPILVTVLATAVHPVAGSPPHWWRACSAPTPSPRSGPPSRRPTDPGRTAPSARASRGACWCR